MCVVFVGISQNVRRGPCFYQVLWKPPCADITHERASRVRAAHELATERQPQRPAGSHAWPAVGRRDKGSKWGGTRRVTETRVRSGRKPTQPHAQLQVSLLRSKARDIAGHAALVYRSSVNRGRMTIYALESCWKIYYTYSPICAAVDSLDILSGQSK